MDGLRELVIGGVSLFVVKYLWGAEERRQQSVQKLENEKIWEVSELVEYLNSNKDKQKTLREEMAIYGKTYLVKARITTQNPVQIASTFSPDVKSGKKLSSASPALHRATLAVAPQLSNPGLGV